MSLEQGLILHLQRLSTEDGPGIRTTVFFKGCSLRCAWCHNPESLSPKAQVQWIENRCIDCETCVNACPNHALTMTARGIEIDRERCSGCGTCAEECPGNAMQLLGESTQVDDLLNELLKDRTYFEKSGGGVTLSGGEPTLQPDFAAALARRLQEAGVHVALDTCGLCSVQSLDKILPYINLVLFDLKEIDPVKHRAFTGQGNQNILDNLLYIRDRVGKEHRIAEEGPATVLWVRTPLIPGATATRENIVGIGEFIAQKLPGQVERWELCSFNNLCRDKYRRLDMEWQYTHTPLLPRDGLGEFEQYARQSGVDPQIVIATGATRISDPEIS